MKGVVISAISGRLEASCWVLDLEPLNLAAAERLYHHLQLGLKAEPVQKMVASQ